MRISRLSVLAVCSLGFLGCSTPPKMANGEKFEKDVVLATSGDKSMPDWASDGEMQPFVIKTGKVYSVGITTLRGDERPEAGLRMAETNARANIAKAISNRMEYIFQGSEENYSFESTQAKFIGSEVSSLTSHSMTIDGHFWKRYFQMQEDGSKRIFYKVYALVTMTEPDLKQAVFHAIHDGEQKNKLSKNFDQQVNQQWNRFVEGEPSENRKPSNEQSE